MLKTKLMPLNLQFFAEPEGGTGDGAGTEEGNGNGPNGNTEDNPENNPENKKTFDDVLKGGFQAEFDRRVAKAINTAVSNAEEKWKLFADEKASEEEKMAKMTASEKAQYQLSKREAELARKEQEIRQRELSADAKNKFAAEGLPTGLSDILNYADEETYGKSFEAVKSAFNTAVGLAVEEKLKGGKPPKGQGADRESTLEQQISEALKDF